jgi:hypothetical protein
MHLKELNGRVLSQYIELLIPWLLSVDILFCLPLFLMKRLLHLTNTDVIGFAEVLNSLKHQTGSLHLLPPYQFDHVGPWWGLNFAYTI